MPDCSITDEYRRKKIETVIMENEYLRIEVLSGKGGDITEIRDKRTDVNVLFEAPHEWYGFGQAGIGVSDGEFEFLDHYPGGWQDVLPMAGGPDEGAGGAPLAQHGETPIVPWDGTITEDSADRVVLRLSVDLSRYPFHAERRLILESGDPTLIVEEQITNQGEVEVAYSWLQHIALGEPLIAPEAYLEIDATRGIADPDHDPDTTRFTPGKEFDWPSYDDDGGQVDLTQFPSKQERVHDIVALTGFEDGRYTVSNPDIDLSVTVDFDPHLYEWLWYWGAFGGFESAPFFGRNYNLGLEPSTSRPVAGLERAIDNDTANTLGAGESVKTHLSVQVGRSA